ncbi:MAG: CCA tRNA nucleotidyltransferase [Candidatus Micrarchaeia archaeon]|jgi:tRNA nucleotidyltransferase (CCA-adding enzyme)
MAAKRKKTGKKKAGGKASYYVNKAELQKETGIREFPQKKNIFTQEHTLDAICEKLKAQLRPLPSEVEEERKRVGGLMAKMRTIVPREVEIELAGSVAKGTNLRQDWDFDIFLLFPKEYSLKDLEVLGLEWAKASVKPHKWHIGYAEHPYLNAELDGRPVDIVPSFKIFAAEEMQSSVDRSQLHTRYVLENMSSAGKDEVRLLKQFMKALGVYGAELKIEGFSGYLCELLILNYGTFKELVEEAATWREPIIDIAKHHDGHDLRAKFSEPMIAVDPVDRNRNVAAAVSRTTLSKFIIGCQSLLEKPSVEKFLPKKIVGEKERLKKAIRARSTEVVGLIFSPPKVVPDILWPQLRKASTSIAKHLEMHGFKLLGSEFWSDEKKKCALLFEMEVHSLPKVVKVQGPEVHFDSQVSKFSDAHRKTAHKIWVEGSRIVALENRKFEDAAGLLKHIAREPELYGIPHNLYKLVKRAKLARGEALLSAVPAEVMHKFLLGEEL